MISYRSFLGIRRHSISYVLLLSLVLSGCRSGESSVSHKGGIGQAIAALIIETPMRISAAVGAYYQQVGRWPSSACDLEEFDGGHFFDLDWASLRDTIVFEELPDGGLKIISTDPHYRFTMMMDAPPDQEVNELMDT